MTCPSPAWGEVGQALVDKLNALVQSDGSPWPVPFALSYIPLIDSRMAGFTPILVVAPVDREIELTARCRDIMGFDLGVGLMQRMRSVPGDVTAGSKLIEEIIWANKQDRKLVVPRSTIADLDLQLTGIENSPVFDYDRLREDNVLLSVVTFTYTIIV